MNSDQRLDEFSGALDRELRALLSEAPSPEFLVRVRQRIATDASAGFWHGWRGIARLAIPVTLIALLGIVMLNPETAVTPPPDRAREVQRGVASGVSSRAEPDGSTAVQPPVVAPRRSRRRQAVSARVESPVVMLAGEMRTLQAFLEGIQTRPATSLPVVVAGPSEVVPLAIGDIAVAVIDITPIAVPALQESAQ